MDPAKQASTGAGAAAETPKTGTTGTHHGTTGDGKAQAVSGATGVGGEKEGAAAVEQTAVRCLSIACCSLRC